MRSISLITFLILTVGTAVSQAPPSPPAPSQTPPISEQLTKILDTIAPAKLEAREQREMAYAKLLEGQRYMWTSERLRSRAGRQHNVQLAREAFKRSVELDPTLSEGYTALAELAINSQPQDADEAIRLATLSTRVNPNNYGARRILARLHTFKSRLTGGTFDAQAAQSAINEWKHVSRIDPRNAEAWALLSELYDRTGKTDEAIEALGKWLASTPPIDTRFYQMIMGGQNLAPENASIKLGSLLLKTGRTREAIRALSTLIADDPDNFAAVDLLREAVEDSGADGAALAIEPLRQAVNANPSNVSLINLLAGAHAKAGRSDEAAKLLRDSAGRLMATDRVSASMIEINLGDLMARSDRLQDAIAAYEKALAIRVSRQTPEGLSDDDREFAMHAFEKMIRTLKAVDRMNEVKAVIDRSRLVLGKDDLFPDRQLISLYRETGNRPGALAAIRTVRQKAPSDYGLIRLEATLLTETGKVDEAVAMIRKLIETTNAASSTPSMTPGSGSVTIAVPASDAFSNYLFISQLYSQANRGKEAAEAANQAHSVARGSERKQIARLTLATAQQNSGDFKGAEATLRELLKETPGNPIAMNNLGYFLLERNERFEEAFILIEQAVKIDPTNPSYLDSLGWAYFKLGKLADAEKYLKEALRYDSSSGTIHEHLGDVYQKQGKLDLAKGAWNRAVSLFSDAADVMRVKAKLASGN